MKAKPGFVLRTIADDYMLMPVDQKIGEYKAAVLLNRLSAFVWEKMQEETSREELLSAVLGQFEVEEAEAAADLDALLDQLNQLDLIDNQGE